MDKLWSSYITMMENGFIPVTDKDEECTESYVNKAHASGKHKPHLKGRDAKTADWRHRLHGSGLFHYSLYAQFGRGSLKTGTEPLPRGRCALYKEMSIYRLDEVDEDIEVEKYIDPVRQEYKEQSMKAAALAAKAKSQFDNIELIESQIETIKAEMRRLEGEKLFAEKVAKSFWRKYKIASYYAEKTIGRIHEEE